MKDFHQLDPVNDRNINMNQLVMKTCDLHSADKVDQHRRERDISKVCI